VEREGPSPAKIIRGLKNEQYKEEDTIILKALISGNPTPKVDMLLFFLNESNFIFKDR
jgi:hypothetical protein